jgi:hypothetical protein
VVGTRRRTKGRGPSTELRVGAFARIDIGRGRRTGVPEIILGEGKSADHLIEILHALARRGEGALVSRPTTAQKRRLAAEASAGLPLSFLVDGRVVRLAGRMANIHARAPVALLAAGTGDVPIAEESRAILEPLGVRCLVAYDVGVAGLHRLLRAVRRLERQHPGVYLVFAGREGALPTVVAGLVKAPVVGIPVSIGYGSGGGGKAALNALLQSCAPIAVVNIDGAVPAALVAARILAPRPPYLRSRRTRASARRLHPPGRG